MKTPEEVEEKIRKVNAEGNQLFLGMTYQEGVDEALRWVLEEIKDEEFFP